MPMPGGGGSSGAIRAGAAFVEIFTKPNYKGLDDMANRLRRFGAGLAKIGAFTAGAGAALLTPLAALFKGGLDMAGEMQDLQDQFGLTAEGISKLGYAAQVAGAGLEELEPILKGLAKANTDGRPLDEFALDFADSLLAIENPSERARAAMDNLGKGGLKFLKVAGDLKGLFGEAPILNQQTLDAADSFGQSLNKIWVAAKASLLPFASYAAGAAESMAIFARQNASVLQIVAAVGAGLVVAGTAISMLGGTFIAASLAVKSVLFAWGGLTAVFAAAVSPLGLLTIGVGAAAVALHQFGGLGKETLTNMGTGWRDAFAGMTDAALTAFAGVSDALKSGDMALAGQIALAGLQTAWEYGWAALKTTWLNFKKGFENGWDDVGDAVALIFNDMFAGLEIAFNDFGAFLLRNFGELVKKLAQPVVWLIRQIDSEMAGAMQTVLDAIPTDDATVNAARDRQNRKVEAERDGIAQLIIDEGKARNAAPVGADLTAAQAAEERLRKLRERAAAGIPMDTPKTAGRADLLSAAVGSVRGAFQISNAAQQFGSGDTVGKQLVVEARNQTQQAKMTNEKLDTLTSAVMQSTPKFW